MNTKNKNLLTSSSSAINLSLRRTLVRSVLLFSFSLVGFTQLATAQLMAKKETFTHADTLRGSLNPNRDWWDVLRYDITVEPDFEKKTIEGKCVIKYKLVKPNRPTSKKIYYLMQIDLQEPLIIDSVLAYFATKTYVSKPNDGNIYLKNYFNKVPFTQTKNVCMVDLNSAYDSYFGDSITIYYHGKPKEAIRPPWDGGWIWRKDAKGNPWMSVACQGLGASAWYPCKDYQGDEPDNGASLTMIVPDTLMAVANGRLIQGNEAERQRGNEVSQISNLKSYTWEVKNPINNYLIIPSIGKYVNFTDTLMGEKGKLDLSYWVLDYNLEKAKEQFKQAKLMLRAFEYWFGPYPFYEDSYKLVESPHLGMEHQSATAYGNKFGNGYLGRDLSGSGWGLKWDYIIVHESGHEWFANNITTNDIADMWVHEGFTDYSETLFTEYYYGKEAGNDYNYGQRKGIQNTETIIGPYGVNKEGSGDMYPKGANLLHTIRHSINNDSLFRQILRGLNKDFYHKTVTTQQVENYISKKSGINFQKTFDQYLRNIKIPQLNYMIDTTKATVTVNWTNCIDGFDMPITIMPTNKHLKITTKQQSFHLTNAELAWFNTTNIERQFYINVAQLDSK
ncbi:M1 family metallopeptidase [Parasediminibacterium paludis]|uniref:M1 family metallopeptidase n=1 Tax=Parasediminibacterium paludis TaxID=908966 RepID=A0ABV8PWX1_9BACT